MIARGWGLWAVGSEEYPLPFAGFSSMHLTRRECEFLFMDYPEVGALQGMDRGLWI